MLYGVASMLIEKMTVAENLLGDFIVTKREELSLSQTGLAKLAGVSQSYINQLERGVNPSTGLPISPTSKTLGKLAKALRVPPGFLQKLASGEQPNMGDEPGIGSDRVRELAEAIRQLPQDGQDELATVLEYLRHKYQKGK